MKSLMPPKSTVQRLYHLLENRFAEHLTGYYPVLAGLCRCLEQLLPAIGTAQQQNKDAANFGYYNDYRPTGIPGLQLNAYC